MFNLSKVLRFSRKNVIVTYKLIIPRIKLRPFRVANKNAKKGDATRQI